MNNDLCKKMTCLVYWFEVLNIPSFQSINDRSWFYDIYESKRISINYLWELRKVPIRWGYRPKALNRSFLIASINISLRCINLDFSLILEKPKKRAKSYFVWNSRKWPHHVDSLKNAKILKCLNEFCWYISSVFFLIWYSI